MADAPQTERPLIPKGGKLRLTCPDDTCFIDDLTITSNGGSPTRSPTCPNCTGPLKALGDVYMPSVDASCACGHPASDHMAPNWRGQVCGGADVPWDACVHCCCNGSVSQHVCAETELRHPGYHAANQAMMDFFNALPRWVPRIS